MLPVAFTKLKDEVAPAVISNFSGLVPSNDEAPMPTLPAVDIRIFSVLLVMNGRS